MRLTRAIAVLIAEKEPSMRSPQLLRLAAVTLLAAAAIGWATPARASTAVNVGDTWADKSRPTTTHGASNPLRILKETATYGAVAYLKFQSAEAGHGQLTVDFSNAAVGFVELRRAPTDWSESTVTWNSRPCQDLTLCPVIDTKPIPDHTYLTFDAGDIQAGVNGFMVISLADTTPAEFQSFDSKESKRAGRRPVLTVTP
jgi:hypothetical protein